MAMLNNQMVIQSWDSQVPMVMHIDLPPPLHPRTLILGEPVLQRRGEKLGGSWPWDLPGEVNIAIGKSLGKPKENGGFMGFDTILWDLTPGYVKIAMKMATEIESCSH